MSLREREHLREHLREHFVLGCVAGRTISLTLKIHQDIERTRKIGGKLLSVVSFSTMKTQIKIK